MPAEGKQHTGALDASAWTVIATIYPSRDSVTVALAITLNSGGSTTDIKVETYATGDAGAPLMPYLVAADFVNDGATGIPKSINVLLGQATNMTVITAGNSKGCVINNVGAYALVVSMKGAVDSDVTAFWRC